MSRRPPGADRTEANKARLKQLVKLESNKTCADCKRNKHPRWASWNIGVFVCIRCSGIHRGMGTHISRVKSVDLDSWTDEQTESMIRWGNARANKYWEHKLAEGHVPNEAKIENFIRTKYDSKRWVMDGPLPDPNTLETNDDDVPLNVVQERVKERERSGSIRTVGGPSVAPPPVRAPQVDLFGDDPTPQPARPSTTEPATSRTVPPKAPAAVAKQTKPGEGLLGLDFFGGAQSGPPARPSSTGPNTPSALGRSDLKQSILSLYASKPAAPPPQQAAPAFGSMQGMQSSPLASPVQAQSNTQALGGLGDAFGSLSFTQSTQPKAQPFSSFAPPTGHSRQASQVKSPPILSGGGFFDTKPTPPSKVTSPPSQPASHGRQPSTGFGGFGDFSSASSVTSTQSPPPASSSMGDLFDMSAPPPPPKPAVASSSAQNAPSSSNYSAFNLSQPTPAPAPAPAPASTRSSKAVPTSTMPSLSMSSADAWGSNDAWAAPDPAAAASSQPTSQQPTNSTFKTNPPQVTTFDSGWGDPITSQPANTTASASGFSVQQDEEFGGWSHASPVATTGGPKQSGVGGNQDDLFGNVWE